MVYLDDVIVYSSDLDGHGERLAHILQRVEEAGLKVNLSKCRFAQGEVRYLGHIVSAEGVKPDPGKISAVQSFPTPSSAKEVKSFLGLAGYYRRFIPKFSEMSKPLTSLLGKDKTFHWSDREQKAFDDLRGALCSSDVLIYPDFRDPFLLSTDASGVALGAVLSQIREGHERPVAYASRQLSRAEQNYSTTERELLAVVWATAQFRCFLIGRRFTLVTDHAALKWMLHLKDPSAKLTRWALRLSEFDYEVVHRPGVKHQNADGLSRAVAQVQDQANEAHKTTRGPTEKDRWRREQERDLWCSHHRNRFPDKVALEAGLWYWTNGEGDRKAWKVMVPTKMRSYVIRTHHDTPWSGHPGVERTTTRIREQFYWPELSRDVERFVKSCHACNTRKTPKSLASPLGKVEVAKFPLDMVSLDLVEFPTSHRGNRYLLTMIDNFTRYAEAVPMRSQTAEETARAVVREIILRHGAPRYLLTDRGTNFVSQLFKTMCRVLRIKKLQTTAYHPQSNGLVERMHRTLVDSLAHYVSRDGRNWDEWIPFALMAYRTTVHSSTGFSPHYLFYGRELELPFDCPYILEEESPGAEEYARTLREKLSKAHAYAKETELRARERWTREHDRGKQRREYEVGQKVYLLEPAVPLHHAKKFHRPWTGPHVIHEKISPTTYELTLASGGRYVVHIDRLKPALEREDEPVLTPVPQRTTWNPPAGVGGGWYSEAESDQSNAEDSHGQPGTQEESARNVTIAEFTEGGSPGVRGETSKETGSPDGTTAPTDPTWYPETDDSREGDQRQSPYELRTRHEEAESRAPPVLDAPPGVNVRPRRRRRPNSRDVNMTERGCDIDD